ncbi:MAG TPA: O-antigen ligase family protein [Candidatus Paceibacterota bacterium]|nr:O-antigen ligase family protein [Candidatus Paceibacterota bacterium]
MKLKDILRKVVIVGIFITPFIPLVVMPSLFFPFITGKNFLFRIVVEVVFFAWVALACCDASYRPKKSSVLWSFVALVVVICFADAFGANPYKSFWSNFERMEGFITLAHLFAFFVVASSVLAREKIWDWLVKVTLGVSVYISLYGVFQLLGFISISQGGVRVDGPFGNATYLAIYTVFIIFFCAIFSAREWQKKISPVAMKSSLGGILLVLFLFLLFLTQTTVPHIAFAATIGILILIGAVAAVILAQKYSVAWIYGAIALINLVILYYTATRGAILGFIGAVVIMAIIGLFAGKEMKMLRTASLWILGATVVLILGFLLLKNTSFVQNSPVLGRFASISFNSSETDARLYVWNMAIKGFEERPILGWGQENFNLVFNKFYDPRMYSQEQWFDRTHDVILDWLINGGVLGLAAYLFLIGSAVWLLWKRTKISFAEKLLYTGLFAAYFINNIFVFDNITSYILYISLLAYIQAKGTEEVALSQKTSGVVSEGTTFRIVLPIVSIIGIFVIYVLNYPAYSASRSLIGALETFSSGTVTNDTVNTGLSYFQKAIAEDTVFGMDEEGLYEIREQIVSATQTVVESNADNSVKQTFAEFALGQVQAQIAATPYDARYQLFAANFYQEVGMIPQAEAAYQTAVALSPGKQSILFELGGLYISEKKYDDALAIFKEAYTGDTDDIEAKENYAAAAIYDGQTALAASLMTNPAVALSDAVAKAYLDTNQWQNLISLFETRIATLPEDVNNRTSLIAAYVKAGENAKAIAEINTLVQMYPSYADVGKQAIEEIQSGKSLQ